LPDIPKILLLEPFYPPESAWGSFKVERGYLPPLGLISIYQWLLHKGYQVDFLDTQFGDDDQDGLIQKLKKGQYDVVGMPVFTPTAGYVFETAKMVREALPETVIVYGGVHVTDRSTESFEESPECDFIIRREGEYTLVELIESMKKGCSDFSHIEGLTWRKTPQSILANPDRDLIANLDHLPLGLFGKMDLTRYVPHPSQYVTLPNYPVFTQRGCPYPCTFCEAATTLGKKMRVFSPARVIEELKILKYEKGAKGIYFQDSTFTMNRKYVVEIFQLMIKEGLNDLLWSCNTRADCVDPELLALMYEAGCRIVFYGIESGNQVSLDLLKKHITVERQEEAVRWTHEANLNVICSYILCLPGETEEMVENTIKYAKRIGSSMALFYLPVPFPGSDLYQSAKESGGLRETKKWNDFLSVDYDNPVYINPLIGKERMKYLYKKAYWDYYTCFKVWAYCLKGLARDGGIGRYARGLNAMQAMMFNNIWEFVKEVNFIKRAKKIFL
jgi:anaerobic magnesium-protoporphyrin IX monomethyl ester cyclase